MNLLDDELIKKYFGCDHGKEGYWVTGCERCGMYGDKTALRVFHAMQTTITPEDSYLYVNAHGQVGGPLSAKKAGPFEGFHPDRLRVPVVVEMPDVDKTRYFGYSLRELRNALNYAEACGWKANEVNLNKTFEEGFKKLDETIRCCDNGNMLEAHVCQKQPPELEKVIDKKIEQLVSDFCIASEQKVPSGTFKERLEELIELVRRPA